MKAYEHRMDIAAPIGRVWALTIDVEQWPNLFPTVTSVSKLDPGPLRIGSQARIRQPGQPERVWTVEQLLTNERFVWSTQAKGFAMRAIHQLTPTASGTTNTLRLEVTGPAASLLGTVIGRRTLQVLRTENEGFRAAAEQHSQRSATQPQ